MGSLFGSKKASNLIGRTIAQARAARGGTRYDGSSSKKFKGSTSVTGRTIGAAPGLGAAPVSPDNPLVDPRRRTLRIPRPAAGGAVTPLSR